MDYHKYSFVISAPNRKNIVLALDKEKTPKDLTKELGKQDANISRALRELLSEKIIKCLNPDDKRGRIYTLTPAGRELRKKLLDK